MDKTVETTLSKAIRYPSYIFSYEFIMKHVNYVDNKDGTITFKRTPHYEQQESKSL